MEQYAQALKITYLAVKVASRCNLNCSYCYMYNKGDGSYKDLPKVMSDETVDSLLERTYSHCVQHNNTHFIFGFHGGEPLLAGPEFYQKFVAKANRMLLPAVQPVYILQTNAVLLDEAWCKVLGELNINLGISVDPSPELHDKFRLDHAGRGSYKRTIQGLEAALSSAYLPSKPIILCVINPETDPIDTYNHFRSLGVRGVDFLFPFDTYDNISTLLNIYKDVSETPFADWLIKLFDLWMHEAPERKLEIRLFDGIVQSVLGQDFPADFLGELNNEVLVIETDGGIEAIDTLKTCGYGFTKAGCNVRTHELDDALQCELASLYVQSHTKLCTQCLNCPIRELCGGGYLAHRYRRKNGFNNTSVFCKDLLKLISYIQNNVVDHLPASLLQITGIEKLSFEEVNRFITNEANYAEHSPYVQELEKFSVRDTVRA
jgi:uncharacterized protein